MSAHDDTARVTFSPEPEKDAKRVRVQLAEREPRDGASPEHVTWLVWRVPRAINVGLPKGAPPRYVSGWQYRDHDGVERFVEGNWLALVERLRQTASNYGFDASIS
jgi:hypothetical protein